MNETINKIKQLLPDKPNAIHHDIEYVELVNQIKYVIKEDPPKHWDKYFDIKRRNKQ